MAGGIARRVELDSPLRRRSSDSCRCPAAGPECPRTSSVRPAPTSPANPKISPGRTENETSLRPTRHGETLDLRAPVAAAWIERQGLFGKEIGDLAPDHHRRHGMAGERGGRRAPDDQRPVAHDDDLVGDALDLVELVRDVDDGDRLPPASARSGRRGGSASEGVSVAVGSSMISRRALRESALAISTSCFSATIRWRTGVSGVRASPTWDERGLGLRGASPPRRAASPCGAHGRGRCCRRSSDPRPG